MVSIVGSGNVAYHLATAFASSGVAIEAVMVRDIEKARIKFHNFNITDVKDQENLMSSIIILAVSDSAISQVGMDYLFPDKAIIVHTAGSVSINELSHFGFERYGCLYPLQTLSADSPIENYRALPFFVEGSDVDTTNSLVEFAESISDQVSVMDSESRLLVHLAGVIINNFTNHLCVWAERMLEIRGLPLDIMHPLIKETYRKLLLSQPSSSQTGPAIRKDRATMNKHLELIVDQRSRLIYKELSKQIMEFHDKSSK